MKLSIIIVINYSHSNVITNTNNTFADPVVNIGPIYDVAMFTKVRKSAEEVFEHVSDLVCCFRCR